MAVLLLGQTAHLLLLAGQEDDLVIDDTLYAGNAVNHRHQVNRHGDVVDFNVGIGTDECRQYDVIHIDKAIDLKLPLSHADMVVTDLEVAHRYVSLGKMLGKVVVNIVTHLVGRKETGGDVTVTELVPDLADLDKEVLPLAAVIAEQPLFLVFQRDGQVGGAVGIFPSFEIAEVTLGKELTLYVVLGLVLFPGEDILLVDGIAFPKCGHQ